MLLGRDLLYEDGRESISVACREEKEGENGAKATSRLVNSDNLSETDGAETFRHQQQLKRSGAESVVQSSSRMDRSRKMSPEGEGGHLEKMSDRKKRKLLAEADQAFASAVSLPSSLWLWHWLACFLSRLQLSRCVSKAHYRSFVSS